MPFPPKDKKILPTVLIKHGACLTPWLVFFIQILKTAVPVFILGFFGATYKLFQFHVVQVILDHGIQLFPNGQRNAGFRTFATVGVVVKACHWRNGRFGK